MYSVFHQNLQSHLMLKQAVFSKQRLGSQKLPWKLSCFTSAKADVCITHTAKVLVGATVVGVPRSAKSQTSFHHYLKCRILPDGDLETGAHTHTYLTPQNLQVNLQTNKSFEANYIHTLTPISGFRTPRRTEVASVHWPSCRIPTQWLGEPSGHLLYLVDEESISIDKILLLTFSQKMLSFWSVAVQSFVTSKNCRIFLCSSLASLTREKLDRYNTCTCQHEVALQHTRANKSTRTATQNNA